MWAGYGRDGEGELNNVVIKRGEGVFGVKFKTHPRVEKAGKENSMIKYILKNEFSGAYYNRDYWLYTNLHEYSAQEFNSWEEANKCRVEVLHDNPFFQLGKWEIVKVIR